MMSKLFDMKLKTSLPDLRLENIDKKKSGFGPYATNTDPGSSGRGLTNPGSDPGLDNVRSTDPAS